MKPEYKLVAKASYVRTIEALAAEIWPDVFRRWLNGKQVRQLLAAVQSEDVIADDIDRDVNYFLIQLAGKPVGYFAFHTTNTALILDHLYLQPGQRRHHIGKDVVQYCERLGRGDEKGRLCAVSHARNLDTTAFFKAMGFRAVSTADREIGGVTLSLTDFEKYL